MNFFNMLELDQSSTLKKILSIMKLTVVFFDCIFFADFCICIFTDHKVIIECTESVNKGHPLFDRKSD